MLGLLKAAAPAIADIDGDGRNEIIINGDFWGGRTAYPDKIWVYDLGGPAHGPVLWGQEHWWTPSIPERRLSVYAPPRTFYTLTTSTTGNGGVKTAPIGIDCGSDCSEPYVSGTSVTLTATPASGHQFNGWKGACSGVGLTCTVVLDGHKAVTAEFAPIRYSLTISPSGMGSGAVTSTPAGIDCGTTCTAVFNSGTEVTLTARASDGSLFTGWSGACSGKGNPCSVSMSSAG